MIHFSNYVHLKNSILVMEIHTGIYIYMYTNTHAHPQKVNRFEPLAVLASDLSLSPVNIHFQVQVKNFTCYFDLHVYLCTYICICLYVSP